MYDAIGQLIRVNDQWDTTAGTTGTTWVFTYDLGGNILTKNAYAYTTGTVGTAVQSHNYTYGNAGWKDLLTAYDGTTITYDQIGNPLSDGTWTYTWEHGRQLKQMVKTGETVSFEYNEDGLRTKKISTSKGVTEYTLHGKNIVHLIQGNQSLHFFYDAQGKPSVVEWNNNGAKGKYAYLYNLQGDVVAIVNSSGTKVVEYAYDAWGKPIAKTGSMASTLGTLNPFRYRGYVYDEETELYYLRSRYYNPELCKFLSADVLIRGNLYCYCKNNSVYFADYEGREEKPTISLPGNDEMLALIMGMLKSPDDYYYYGSGTGADNLRKSYGIPICCSYAVFKARGKKGMKGPDKLYEECGVGLISDLYEKGQTLEPGMIVFKYGKDHNGKTRYYHVGIVVLCDWHDGRGPQLAVFQSTSHIFTEDKWRAYFYNDAYGYDENMPNKKYKYKGGPNVTDFSELNSDNEFGEWTHYGYIN